MPHRQIQTPEALREALLLLQRENEVLRLNNVEAKHLLDALDALLGCADDEPFLRVFAALREVFTFSQAMVLAAAPERQFPDDETLECLVAEPAGLVGSRWPLGPTFRKVLGGRVIATLSTQDMPEWRESACSGLSSAQSALYVPVRTRDSRGILVMLRDIGARGFDRQHVALGRRFSLLVSHALATRHASQSLAEGQRLRELTERLQRSKQSVKHTLQMLNEIVNGLPIGLGVQDATGRMLVINDVAAQALGVQAAQLRGRLPFAIDGAVDSDVARRRARFEAQLAGASVARERDVVIDGQPRSVLITSKPLQVQDQRLLLTAAFDITERKQRERELAHRAYFDELTGLPNRTLLQQRAAAALQRHAPDGRFALAFIDLDRFKQINDLYSHAVGDALLRAAAQRVLANIRSSDTLARISGDEFMLLIEPLLQPRDLPLILDRVVDALRQPFDIEGHRILTSASVGASIFPLHGTSYESLSRCADHAMYRAKRERRGGATYFDPALGDNLTARADLEQRLRTAIRERRFCVAFQPKVDIGSGVVLGFEALARWVEEDGSVRMPGTFIELATEIGLLDALTHLLLDDVIACLPRLTQRFGDTVSISVNIGARQAGDVAFMETVMHRLGQGLGQRIVLELTEDALVAAQRFQKEVLPRLREMGVRVSIDDFGTGYSSLSTLTDVTADEVKVDRSFITDVHSRPRSQGILRAIESLCRALAIDVVAEGVETDAERDYLLRHTGIRCAQGYLFARPLMIDALLEAPLHVAPTRGTAAFAD